LFNQRDHAHRITEEQKQKADGADRDRLRFHMLRTLSRSREHHIEEEGGDPVTLITHSLSHLHASHLCSRVSCFRLVLLRAEEEEDEKEDVLFNLAQTVNLSYFDYHSPDVIGEATEITPNIPSTRPNTHSATAFTWCSARSLTSLNSLVCPRLRTLDIYAQLVENVKKAAAFSSQMKHTLDECVHQLTPRTCMPIALCCQLTPRVCGAFAH
jgi:hypothetical protein